MIHWAHAFGVAARPSLDLSLLHAANTQETVLHGNRKKATLSHGRLIEASCSISSVAVRPTQEAG
jgi:hypothetical protein